MNIIHPNMLLPPPMFDCNSYKNIEHFVMHELPIEADIYFNNVLHTIRVWTDMNDKKSNSSRQDVSSPSQIPSVLNINIFDSNQRMLYSGKYTKNILEELTRKTGHFQPFMKFIKFLNSAVLNKSNEFKYEDPSPYQSSVEFLSGDELSKLRQATDKKWSPSLSNHLRNDESKRYLIISVIIQNQKFHYPLILQCQQKSDCSIQDEGETQYVDKTDGYYLKKKYIQSNGLESTYQTIKALEATIERLQSESEEGHKREKEEQDTIVGLFRILNYYFSKMNGGCMEDFDINETTEIRLKRVENYVRSGIVAFIQERRSMMKQIEKLTSSEKRLLNQVRQLEGTNQRLRISPSNRRTSSQRAPSTASSHCSTSSLASRTSRISNQSKASKAESSIKIEKNGSVKSSNIRREIPSNVIQNNKSKEVVLTRRCSPTRKVCSVSSTRPIPSPSPTTRLKRGVQQNRDNMGPSTAVTSTHKNDLSDAAVVAPQICNNMNSQSRNKTKLMPCMRYRAERDEGCQRTASNPTQHPSNKTSRLITSSPLQSKMNRFIPKHSNHTVNRSTKFKQQNCNTNQNQPNNYHNSNSSNRIHTPMSVQNCYDKPKHPPPNGASSAPQHSHHIYKIPQKSTEYVHPTEEDIPNIWVDDIPNSLVDDIEMVDVCEGTSMNEIIVKERPLEELTGLKSDTILEGCYDIRDDAVDTINTSYVSRRLLDEWQKTQMDVEQRSRLVNATTDRNDLYNVYTPTGVYTKGAHRIHTSKFCMPHTTPSQAVNMSLVSHHQPATISSSSNNYFISKHEDSPTITMSSPHYPPSFLSAHNSTQTPPTPTLQEGGSTSTKLTPPSMHTPPFTYSYTSTLKQKLPPTPPTLFDSNTTDGCIVDAVDTSTQLNKSREFKTCLKKEHTIETKTEDTYELCVKPSWKESMDASYEQIDKRLNALQQFLKSSKEVKEQYTNESIQ